VAVLALFIHRDGTDHVDGSLRPSDGVSGFRAAIDLAPYVDTLVA
jgi:hypothetical protein